MNYYKNPILNMNLEKVIWKNKLKNNLKLKEKIKILSYVNYEILKKHQNSILSKSARVQNKTDLFIYFIYFLHFFYV